MELNIFNLVRVVVAIIAYIITMVATNKWVKHYL